MKILVSGGGTGGHIYPALSIAKIVKKKLNADVFYIGSTNGLDQTLVDPNEFNEVLFLNTIGLHRKNPVKAAKSIMLLRKAQSQAISFMKQHNPDYVIVTGGFATVPVILAAKKLNIKLLVHEQNSVPGMATNLAAKNAYKIMVSFQDSITNFDQEKTIFTGNPRLREVRKITASEEDKIIIFAGSRGALNFNSSIVNLYSKLNELNVKIVHITGKNYFDPNTPKFENIDVVEYDDDLVHTMASAKLVICRAGATTIAELIGLDKPSILVPSPYVTNAHQHKNADVLTSVGGAILLEEADVEQNLIKMITSLNQNKLATMKDIIMNIETPNFEEKLLEILIDND